MPRSTLLATAALAGVLIAGVLPAAAPAQDAAAPSGRGLLGGVVKPVTTTLDGALQSVSTSTGGAVALPSTSDLTSGAVETVDGTVQVVAGTVDQVAAPVTQALAGPQASLSLPGLAQVDGAPVLDLIVGNVGSEACTPVAALGITGKDGVKIAGGVTQLLSILPGASREYVLPWPAGLAAGTYNVAASVTGCGDLQSIGLSVTVNAPTTAEGRSNPGGGGGGTGGGGTGGGGGASGSTGAASSSTTSHSAGAQNGGASSPGASGTPQSGSAAAPGAPAVNRTVGGDDVSPQQSGGARSTRANGRAGLLGLGAAAGPPAPAGLLADPAADSQKLKGVSGVVSNAVSGPQRTTFGDTASAVVKAIPAVIERAAPALAILGLIGALFFFQEALAKRDPKLALAPIGPIDDLDFDEPANFLRHFAKPPAPRGDG